MVESDDQNSVTAPKTPELQYAEVQTQQADPSRGTTPSDVCFST